MFRVQARCRRHYYEKKLEGVTMNHVKQTLIRSSNEKLWFKVLIKMSMVIK